MAARRALPDARTSRCFDTAFHKTLPEVASTYLLPARFRDRGIRRYGFHGLSVAVGLAERVPAARLVVCHLGGGSSVTAVRDGRSIDTTMGFTPLEGVPMATRAGSVDPGALLYLLRHGVRRSTSSTTRSSTNRGSARWREPATWRRSSATRRRRRGSRSTSTAIASPRRSRRWRRRSAASMRSPSRRASESTRRAVRAAICSRLGFLGVSLDESANERAGGDAEIGSSSSSIHVHVVTAREDVVVARAVRSVA